MFDNFRRSSDVETNSTTDERVVITDDQTQVNSFGLAWDTRLQCFAGCFVLSCVCSLCASTLLFLMRITGFCILTTMGSILSLIGTCFLMGPIKQCQNMFHENRWIASIFYFAFIVMTLIAGLLMANPPLAVICTLGQYAAMIWYSLSYIPYARDFASRVLCSCF